MSTEGSGSLANVGRGDQATKPQASEPDGRGAGCAGEAAGGLAAVAGGPCAGGPDLTDLDPAEASRVLVAQTARFTGSFLRWIDGRTCDGMSHARLRLLQELQRGGPAIMRDLATQLDATPRNMTALVDALEEAGLVARRPHPSDRRATLIELTPAGALEVAQELGPRLDAMSEIFTDLSAEERMQYSGLVSRLMHAIRARLPEC